MKKFSLILAVAIAMVMTACGGDNGQRKAQDLSGAGATFPQPFYNVIFEQFSETYGDMVAYGGVGSGSGVRNLRDKIVDFAGSDAFLSNDEMAKMDAVIHVPTCMGAVVMAFNIDGVKKLNLTGELIADIFTGKINKWNDPSIVKINPNVTLPDAEIIPVYRSDGSGTTFVFTDYLCKVSKTWAANFGAGKSVSFPVGQAGKGNPGVASIISQTKNTIGYVGSEYAFAQKITYANVQNQCGEFVEPTTASISASASGTIPADTRTSITNSDASGAYPITCFTWLIIYKEQNYSGRSKEQAAATLDLLHYVLSNDAQKMASEVHYAPLPKKAVELSLKNLETVVYDGKPISK